METWTISVPEYQDEMLIATGRVYTRCGKRKYYDFSGESLQEAVDERIVPLVKTFNDGCQVLEYPEHAKIEEEIYKYANCVHRNRTIVLTCKCATMWTKESPHYIEFFDDVRITIQEEFDLETWNRMQQEGKV